MKKIFATMMACVALCNVASAITPAEAYLLVHTELDALPYENRKIEYIQNVSYETFRQYAFAVVDKAFATTNGPNGQITSKMHNEILMDFLLGMAPRDIYRCFTWACAVRLNEKDMDTVDTRFAERFTGKRDLWNNSLSRFFDLYPYFPKTCEVLFKEYDINPLVVNEYRRRPRMDEPYSRDYMAARINRLVGEKSEKFGDLKHWLREFVLKSARMRLRERSQNFVVRRDGSNPLQEVFDRVTACVNAPHQQGLKEFVEEYAPGYKWMDVEYPSDMDVMILVGDILNGKEAIDNHRGELFFCLGAEQYNEFIDRYNGRVQK